MFGFREESGSPPPKTCVFRRSVERGQRIFPTIVPAYRSWGQGSPNRYVWSPQGEMNPYFSGEMEPSRYDEPGFVAAQWWQGAICVGGQTAGLAVLLAVAAGSTVAYGLEGRPASGMLVIAHRAHRCMPPTLGGCRPGSGSERSRPPRGRHGHEPGCDGVLVMCHDIELSRVTDIASRPEFAGRANGRGHSTASTTPAIGSMTSPGRNCRRCVSGTGRA